MPWHTPPHPIEPKILSQITRFFVGHCHLLDPSDTKVALGVGVSTSRQKTDYGILSPTEAAPYFAVTPTKRGEWSFRNSNKKRPNALCVKPHTQYFIAAFGEAVEPLASAIREDK